MDTEVRFLLKRVVPCVVLVLIGITLFAVTKRIEVEAGHEVVLVDKPFWTFLDSGGVRPEPLTTGSKWLFYTTEQIPYDVRPVQHTEKFDAATDGTITSDNIPIAFNAYIKVRPITGQTPALHDGFGPGWYDQNLKEVFRTAVRDEVAKATMTGRNPACCFRKDAPICHCESYSDRSNGGDSR
jgi:regulator of protease activity HflC (stomatin/prohibitin superfamily)